MNSRSGDECNAKGCFFALTIHLINMKEGVIVHHMNKFFFFIYEDNTTA